MIKFIFKAYYMREFI